MTNEILKKQSEPKQELASAAINLRRLVIVRAIVLAGLIAVALISVFALHIVLPVKPLAITILVAIALTVRTALRLEQGVAVRDSHLFLNLIADVVGLTVILHFSGGSTNPFATLYLIPLTLTAATLPWRYVWVMFAITIACYSLLLEFYVPLYHSHDRQVEHVLDDFNLHVVGTWLAMLSSGGLIAFFAVRMRETVRERDRLRAQMREQALRHERVLALGTFAAGAAHELSTPLATIAVLSKELQIEGGANAKELQVLRSQVDRCKEIIGSLTAAVGDARAENGTACAVDEYLSDFVVRWKESHEKVSLAFEMRGQQPTPKAVFEATLTQALQNVLNNAADVSNEIRLDANWDDTAMTLEVLDRGPGLSLTAAEHAAEPFFTTKEPGAGMGLGLYLARGTIERLGGELTLKNRSDGVGAVCRIRLPLEFYRVSQA